jgi:hypothetical protein
MIQANELRINNLVKCKISNDAATYRIVEIDGINASIKLDGARYGEIIPINKIKPILLTEELLLKCGAKFREINCGWRYYDIDGFIISANVKDKRIFFSAFDRDGERYVNDFDLELETIHQFQNLYFTLSNKELEVNLC